MNVLAIAGSLRAASINAAFCRAAICLSPAGLDITLFKGLGTLPLFNPDLEEDPPQPVIDFRAAVSSSSALLIASPGYAHGVSGVMKNALDWLVRSEGFVHKPVAVVNTSPRAHHAYDALLEVLRTISATIVTGASITLPLLGTHTTEEAIIASPDISSDVRMALSRLSEFLQGQAT